MTGRHVRRSWEYDPALYAPASYRGACSYDVFIPGPIENLAVALPGDVAGVLSEAEHAIAHLNRGGRELPPIARLLLRAESIASSKVEGMQVDARTLARAETSREMGRRIGPQSAAILANIDAMELAIEQASGGEGIRAQDLRGIHRLLLAGDPAAPGVGEFRNRQNWIGGNDYNPCGADFVPPPPEEVEGLIDDLCHFCAQETLPPLLQAAIAHAQFETIHPFEDGNGRTGRALVQMILRRRGIAPRFVPPVSVVLARQKHLYIRGLTMFREDRLAEWVEIFAAATAAAALLADRSRGRVVELLDRWREQLRQQSNPRSDAAAWVLIDILPAHPVVTVPLAVIATGRTRPAVTNAMDELERAGILTPLSAARRNRAWEAEGLLELVAALCEGRPNALPGGAQGAAGIEVTAL